jgi:transcriptional regulator with XRE-family HTH domain
MAIQKRSLGTELRDVRNLRKLSLRDVEQATGISNAYLSQLENDKVTKPSPHFLHKLAKLYAVDYEMLMEAAGYVHDRSNKTGPKTLMGAALFSEAKLTAEEEQELGKYLQFLRARKT